MDFKTGYGQDRKWRKRTRKGNEMGRNQCLSIYWANGVVKYCINERANFPQPTTSWKGVIREERTDLTHSILMDERTSVGTFII